MTPLATSRVKLPTEVSGFMFFSAMTMAHASISTARDARSTAMHPGSVDLSIAGTFFPNSTATNDASKSSSVAPVSKRFSLPAETAWRHPQIQS